MKNHVGFIGVGNMGGLLLETFLQFNTLQEEEIWVINRTPQKAIALQEKYPGLHLAVNQEEIISQCSIIFLCAKPAQIMEIAKEITTAIKPDQIIVSITSPISVSDLETILNCQVARVIPSIVNRVGKGVSLFTFGTGCTEETKQQLTTLFHTISVPLMITDDKVRISSDLSSCGPAFIAHLIELMLIAATDITPLKENEALQIMEETLIGLGRLLEQKVFTLPELVEKVCVKGGITGEGIRVIDNEIANLFHHLFQATNEKFQEDLVHIKKLL